MGNFFCLGTAFPAAGRKRDAEARAFLEKGDGAEIRGDVRRLLLEQICYN